MNILLLGGGGREHALAWKLAQSPSSSELFIAPGNAGTSSCGMNLDFSATDFEAIKKCCLDKKIEIVIVGPEDPLVKGIYDYFLADDSLKRIPVIGPSKAGAQLEGSKDFAKAFMQRHHIPTAAYKTFRKENLEEAYRFLESLKPPYVLKADGLAAGKGVVISSSLEEAKKEISDMLTHEKFGSASAKVVIEEFLHGIELSVFVLTDGNSYVFLPEAKDYKRIGEGDTGLNTGGMGAISPVPFADKAFLDQVEERIVKPTVEGLKKENIPYKGFIFIGLMASPQTLSPSERMFIRAGKGEGENPSLEPFVIEYNCRLGDPETEVVIPRIKNDLVELFKAVADGKLSGQKIESDPRTAATVMLVSGGYPEDYEKGKVISGLEGVKESLVFHAGTVNQVTSNKAQDTSDSTILTNGGRVLAITSFGKNISEATGKSFATASKISFEKMYFRRDIGKDLLSYEIPFSNV